MYLFTFYLLSTKYPQMISHLKILLETAIIKKQNDKTLQKYTLAVLKKLYGILQFILS